MVCSQDSARNYDKNNNTAWEMLNANNINIHSTQYRGCGIKKLFVVCYSVNSENALKYVWLLLSL